jgi:hypothetical protein
LKLLRENQKGRTKFLMVVVGNFAREKGDKSGFVREEDDDGGQNFSERGG